MTQPVQENTALEQFELTMEGATAKLGYNRDGDRLLLVHTEVPEEFQGQGVGGRLVQAALAKARADHLTVVPWCPYARKWLKEHAEQVGDITVDYKTPPPES